MQDFDFIETPEHVELERRLAGIGSRFIAGLLDTLLIAAMLLAAFLALLLIGVFTWVGGLTGGGFADEVVGLMVAIWIAVVFLIVWGYFVFFELRTNGQSPGKKQQKIRVVKASGGPITFTDVAIRNLLRVVDFLPGFYGVAGVVMFLSRKVQRLGDLAAGTVVVSEVPLDYGAGGGRTTASARSQWESEPSGEALRATGLTPQEYRALASYWARRHQLTLDARQRLLPRLVRPILQRTGETLPGYALVTLERYVADQLGKALAAKSKAKAPPDAGGRP